MTPEQMCGTCIHVDYCMAAHQKDHWCGNHTERSRYESINHYSTMGDTDRKWPQNERNEILEN